ncbi:MAG: FAD-binding protein [Alphaproteobacteria bacterium]|nr:FAD-binding protein [Alphaproteobacteria bacterium]
MTETLKPETPDQLRDAVAWANSDLKPLELVGRGSKRGIGRPVQTAHRLDLSAFSGIALYEPEELVLSAGAATPMAEIEAALEEAGQELSFEPPDYSRVLRMARGAGTLGGVLAGNLAGPRRIKQGAARDHFLGFEGVTGRGDAFKSGGRVVKNVTGYDLCKLMAGSWGTLAALHKVTVKALPRGQKTRTVLVYGPDAAAGVAALSDGLNSPCEVSGAAWLPASIAGRSEVDLVAKPGEAVAAIRVEGFGPSVEYRCQALRSLLAPYGATEELHSQRSRAFWTAVRDVLPFADGADERVIWKISLPPTDAPAFLHAVAEIKGAEAYCDWGGGLVWLALDAPKTGAEGVVRDALKRAESGWAQLFRAPESLRAAVPVFQPQGAGLDALARRVKESFDPNRVLNPGRMSEGV